MNRLIRRAILSWQNWRGRQRLYRADPIMLDLDRQLAEYRKQHKRGSARIVKAKQARLHASLRASVGRRV